MRGVHYVRDETGKDSTGVIAQELQKIAPELVLTAEDENGYVKCKLRQYYWLLIEAVKELSARVKELEGEVKMALPSSGTITLAQIAAEFGGSAPHSLSEYYRGGAYTTSNNTNVPTSGAISLSNFHGAQNQVFYAATGGTVTTSGNYKYHTFTGSGTFAIQTAANSAGGGIDYVVVAGGGGSSVDNSSGAGAGGYQALASQSKSVASYSVVIGAGAPAATSYYSNNGNASSAFGTSSTGGGRRLVHGELERGHGENGGSGGGTCSSSNYWWRQVYCRAR